MVEHEDMLNQEKVYSDGGDGVWYVAGYCPVPSVIMRNHITGEQCHIGVGGLSLKRFVPIDGLTRDVLLKLRIDTDRAKKADEILRMQGVIE